MRNHNGEINEFKKLNIIEKLLQKYRERQQFTGFNPFENKKQFRRTRDEPQMRREDIVQQFENQTTNSYLKYNQKEVVNNFEEKAKKYKKDTENLVDFSTDVMNLIVDRPFGYFQAKNEEYAMYIKEEEDVKDKVNANATQIKKYTNNNVDVYDFNKIFQLMRKKDDDEENNVVINEGDIPFIEELSDINKINQFEEISKSFYYYNKIQSVESQLKKINNYRIEIKRQSLVYGDNVNNINVQFARDMSQSSRNPPTDLSNLTSAELTVVPTELRYCDLLNISSGRLNNKNITLCVRNSAVTKQDLQYQRSVLERLEKKNTVLVDQFVEAGDQDIMAKKDDGGGLEEKQIQNVHNPLQLIETDRLVNQINVLKKKIKDNASSNTKGYQHEFQVKLEVLLSKILENTQFNNPMQVIFNLRHYCTKIEGITRSGFDKRKLLWFYSDCMRFFQLAERDENIKYLIDKMAKQKTITKTVIHEIAEGVQPGDKPYTLVSKSNMLKKEGKPTQSSFRMREFHQLPIKTVRKELTPGRK